MAEFRVTRLHIAVKREDVNTTKLLLNQGANVNDTNKDGRTPLHIAIILPVNTWLHDAESHKEIIRVLLENKANVHAVDRKNRTPLHLAAIAADKYAVEILIEHGANVNATDADGYTPLCLTAEGIFSDKSYYSSRLEIAKVLLENKADVDAVDRKNRTPLHLAAIAVDEHAVKILIEHGANVNATDADGYTPLCLTTEGICRFDESYYSSRLNIAKVLLENKANVNVGDEIYKTHLHRAAIRPNRPLVEILIAYGANVNATNEFGKTPLHEASEEGSEVVEVLIKHGAIVDAVDLKNKTPLHMAASRGNRKVTEMLLNYGANVNAMDKFGQTPLHEAGGEGPEVVEMLIKHGANVNATDGGGYTPLFFVIDQICCAASNTPIFSRVVETLLNNKADVNIRDEENMTPLHHAAVFKAEPKLLKRLIAYWGDINATDRFGRTPRYMSALDPCGIRIGRVETLLDKGSDVNIKDKEGLTPLGFVNKYHRNIVFKKKIVFHMTKLKAAGLYVNEENLRLMQQVKDELRIAPQLEELELECNREVELMKSKGSTRLSLHDIFTTNDPRYALNETSPRGLIYHNYNDLPNYRNLLVSKYQSDKKRIALLKESQKSLIGILIGGDKKIKPVFLPDELLYRILCHLNNGDLQNLILCSEREKSR